MGSLITRQTLAMATACALERGITRADYRMAIFIMVVE
jgi:hypothetical protein